MKFDSLTFPLPVGELDDWVLHRKPMAWIDLVEEIFEDGGLCSFTIDKNGHYLDEKGHFRPSSAFELVAQAFAYVGCLLEIRENDEEAKHPDAMFLTAVSDFHVSSEFAALGLEKSNIYVKTRLLRKVGPMSLIEGEVLREKGGSLLSRCRLKVYSQ